MYIYVNNKVDLYETIKSIMQSKKDIWKFTNIINEFKKDFEPSILKKINKWEVKLEDIFKNDNELSSIITSLKIFVVLNEFKKWLILDPVYLKSIFKENEYWRHQLFSKSILPNVYWTPYKIYDKMVECMSDFIKVKDKYNLELLSDFEKEINKLRPEVDDIYKELKRKKDIIEKEIEYLKQKKDKLQEKLLSSEIQLVKWETINNNIDKNKYIVVVNNILYNPRFIRISNNDKYKVIHNKTKDSQYFFELVDNINNKNNEIKNFNYTYLSTWCDSEYDLKSRKLTYLDWLKNTLELMWVDKIPQFQFDTKFAEQLLNKEKEQEKKEEKLAEKVMKNKIFMQVSEFDYKYISEYINVESLDYKEINIQWLDFVVVKMDKWYYSIHKTTWAVSSTGKTQKECLEKLNELIEKNWIKTIESIINKKTNIFTKCYSCQDVSKFNIDIIRNNNEFELIQWILKNYTINKVSFISNILSNEKFLVSIEDFKSMIEKEFWMDKLLETEYRKYILDIIYGDFLVFIKPVSCGNCWKTFFHKEWLEWDLKCPHCSYKWEQSEFPDINL